MEHRNALDESTAFGSEFEFTTATRHRASRAVVRGRQEESSVPTEVIALCQEIVEV